MGRNQHLDLMYARLVLEQITLSSNLKSRMLKVYGRHLRLHGESEDKMFEEQLELLKLVGCQEGGNDE